MSDPNDTTAMFDAIAPHYDTLNHLLSFHIDKIWRRKTASVVSRHHPNTILDVATGTADLAIRMALNIPNAQVTAIDCSQAMLKTGRKKVDRRNLNRQITLIQAHAEALPFPDHHFDIVTCAFGVRNFGDLEAGLKEMARVTKPQGAIVILEFSQPENLLVKKPYRLYSKHLLPLVGRRISGHQSAYDYLPSSIESFSQSIDLPCLLSALGCTDVQRKSLSGGIASLYECRKKPF